MQQVGNFSKLQAARQHVFYADATARLAAARQAAVAAREELVRQLGLTDEQARALKLPDRLPDLPKAPRRRDEVSQALGAQRLDARLARLELEAAGRSRGIDLVSSLIDVELGARRDTRFEGNGERVDHARVRAGHPAAAVRLGRHAPGRARRPFARGRQPLRSRRARRDLAGARELRGVPHGATTWRATSATRCVPLRKTISEENLLRYNGMLIGVFELLADAREQVSGVIAAIEAQRDFWLADAALSSTLIGRPIAGPAAASPRAGSTAAAEAGH